MDFEAIKKAAEGYRADMTRFLRDLVAIPSESCGEEGVIRRIAAEMEKLAEKFEILPVLSETAANTDTRLGTAQELWQRVETISGKKPITTISGAEPLGPRHMADLMVVCPCTGNTLSKLSNGITDTSVTMAVKSCLRIGLPVVLAVASNDALAASAPNLFRLMNTKNMYLVPLRQDNSVLKPTSLVCRFEYLLPACEAALQGRQLQPVLL